MAKTYEPNVTIITSIYSAKDNFLLDIAKSVKNQIYSGKVTHIFINDNTKNPRKVKGLNIVNNEKNIGLASTLNKGFRMAKTEIVVSLMDDCLPSSNNWLKELVSPLSDKSIAATTSKVEMPLEFWKSFSFFARALTEKEQRVIIPGLDEKGCAYRVSALREFGFLDDKNFRNGGEDTDLTVKIESSPKWIIRKTSAKIYHYHYFSFKSRMKKEIQYARLSGLVSRKYFFKLPLNFKLSSSVRAISFLFLIYSIFSMSMLLPSTILFVLISNIRLPFQVKRLLPDLRIIVLPIVNLYLSMLYSINYIYALLLKPTV